MNEFLEQFVLESRELAEQATTELLALEQSPGERTRLDGAFRAFHTLKGGAGIVDFVAMARAVHAAEDALSSVRNGDLQVSARLIGYCLSVVDQVLQWLDEIERSGAFPVAADSAAQTLAARFEAFTEPQAERVPSPVRPSGGDVLTPAARRLLDEQLLLLAEGAPQGLDGRFESAGRVTANVLRHLSRGEDAARIDSIVSMAAGNTAPLVQAIVDLLGTEASASRTAAPRPDLATRTLRVDAARVEALVALTGELIVAKNSLAHTARTADEMGNALGSDLKRQQVELERLTTQLQHAVLSLRVLPLRMVFQRFQRVVRELAVDLGKPTSLVLEGEDTEADKAIVEMLYEPLLHVMRNALDHGIEPAQERQAAGKPAIATIILRAHRENENVVVTLSDDGRGMDVARVRKAALERGLAEAERLDSMSDGDVIDLIFAPGFSTAGTVTDLSGRGVGLDAVRRTIESVGGRVDVETHPGRASIFRFVLPFSVMVTRIMTVEAGGQVFGIPLDSVVETVRVPRNRIHPVGSGAAFVRRGRTLPVLHLGRTLAVSDGGASPGDAILVVALVAGQLGALEVDRLGERMDVMLKPVEGLLAGMPGVLGTTLLGTGEVLLILNLPELFD